MAEGRPLQLSLVQAQPRLGDLRSNLDQVAHIVAGEDRAGQDLVIFPELNLCGYFLKDLVPETAVRLDGPELRELGRAAGRATVVVGCVLESSEHLFFNAAVVLRAQGIAHVHRKLYLPTYGMFDEQRYLAAGSSVESVELDFGRAGRWRVGALICEDLWHPSAPYLLSRQGVDLLVCPSASPGRGVAEPNGDLGTAALWGSLIRTYSTLFTTFVAYCNRVGFEDGHYFWGGSRIHSPTGEPLGQAMDDSAGVGRRELDREWLRRARIAYPLLRDERPELLRQGLGEEHGGL